MYPVPGQDVDTIRLWYRYFQIDWWVLRNNKGLRMAGIGLLHHTF